MKYSLKEKIEKLLEQERRTKKSLYDYLGMSMQGFDAMMKNNTFTAVRVEKIAEFFDISISELYGATNEKPEDLSGFGGQILSKMAKDIDEMKAMFEEQLRAKDLQIAGLQRTVDVLVGKSEGAIEKPLSEYALTIFDLMDQYKSLSLGHMTTPVQKLNQRGRKVGGTRFSQVENVLANK
ncbi:helix-turn-helix domain-containing protein [Spirosoma sp.]|uniref:helix-turn-helix domain-containing protein n=1 Tax=Spirosoma sp. TaxID=1899569 RepID=UPI002604BC7D|nr:helix-turn-helix domain-containing protein [Spirosoma sp.]MCX6216366.1 hypothetical protein [Spirosoma sp.]